MWGRILFLNVVVAGCVVEDADELNEVEQDAAFGCPIWECGANSPVIKGHKFHEMNEPPSIYEQGLPNEEGVRLVKYQKGSQQYRLDVRQGKLIGYDSNGYAALTGVNGGILDSVMTMRNDNTNEVFLVKVVASSRTSFWAKTPAMVRAPDFESYKLVWTEPAQYAAGSPYQWENLCSRPSSNSDGIPGEHTILMEGDRINAAAKTIGSIAEPRWFTFACATSAPAKLMLTGHAYAALFYGFSTTYLQRQAMLKMFVADYTGSGMPYTTAGTPLRWSDEFDWMNYQDASQGGSTFLGVSLEARWTHLGATCINSQKLRRSDAYSLMTTDAAAGGAPVPPQCANTSATTFDGNHLVSATTNSLAPLF